MTSSTTGEPGRPSTPTCWVTSSVRFSTRADELQTRIDGERRAGKRLRIATLIAVAVGLVALSGLGFAVLAAADRRNEPKRMPRPPRPRPRAPRPRPRAPRQRPRVPRPRRMDELLSGGGDLTAVAPRCARRLGTRRSSRRNSSAISSRSSPRRGPAAILVYSSAAAISPDGRELAVANGLDGDQGLRGRLRQAAPVTPAAGDRIRCPVQPGRPGLWRVAQVTTEGVRVTIVDAASGVEQTVLEAPSVDADRLMLTWSRDNPRSASWTSRTTSSSGTCSPVVASDRTTGTAVGHQRRRSADRRGQR